jgi:hypothetical protein
MLSRGFSGVKDNQFLPVNFAVDRTETGGEFERKFVEHPCVRLKKIVVSFFRFMA